jgi:hypothetical protein
MPAELLVAVVEIYSEEEQPRWGDQCWGDILFDETDSTDTISCTLTILLGMVCFVEGCSYSSFVCQVGGTEFHKLCLCFQLSNDKSNVH